MPLLLLIGLPVALGAGGGLFFGFKDFFGSIAEESTRGFNFIWIAVGLAILVPLVLPYFFTKKTAAV